MESDEKLSSALMILLGTFLQINEEEVSTDSVSHSFLLLMRQGWQGF